MWSSQLLHLEPHQRGETSWNSHAVKSVKWCNSKEKGILCQKYFEYLRKSKLSPQLKIIVLTIISTIYTVCCIQCVWQHFWQSSLILLCYLLFRWRTPIANEVNFSNNGDSVIDLSSWLALLQSFIRIKWLSDVSANYIYIGISWLVIPNNALVQRSRRCLVERVKRKMKLNPSDLDCVKQHHPLEKIVLCCKYFAYRHETNRCEFIISAFRWSQFQLSCHLWQK